ncbi:MAG: GIY-YIG nuclease family protein [Betaproteobacteria bacterium]
MIEAAYVYIMTNKPYGTLYTGVTSDLVKRVWQHREGLADGFTKEHGLKTLVWYERHESMLEAIARDKRIKRSHRDWKVNLIQAMNPSWDDLFESIAR